MKNCLEKKLKSLKHNKNNFSTDQKFTFDYKDNRYFSITDSTNFNTSEKKINKNKSNNNNHRNKKFINLKIKPNSSRYEQRTKPKKPDFLKEIDFYKIKASIEEYQINKELKKLENIKNNEKK